MLYSLLKCVSLPPSPFSALAEDQVTMYFDWANVHQADRYLDDLERLVQENATTLE